MLRTIEFEVKEALMNTVVFFNLVECGYFVKVLHRIFLKIKKKHKSTDLSLIFRPVPWKK